MIQAPPPSLSKKKREKKQKTLATGDLFGLAAIAEYVCGGIIAYRMW